MNQETNARKKEGVMLAIVAIIGIGGLLLLQLARRSDNSQSDHKTVIQQGQQSHTADGQPQSDIQQVPVNLLRENEQPEMNKPFIYELADYSKGGVYLLDPGDGSPRQTFKEGKLTYTYHKPGSYSVSIFALDGAHEYKMLTVNKEVANLTVTKAVSTKTGKPLIDD